MMVSVASRRASPGATTLTGLLATCWPEEDSTRVVIEADEAGGVMAARWKPAHGLTWQPGLIELATLPDPDEAGVVATGQGVSDGLSVVAAPPSPGQVINALNALGDTGAARLAGSGQLRAFVDCGRLTRRSAAIHLARRSVVTVLVCRPELEEIYGMLAGVVELRDAGCHVGLVIVGDGRWTPDEIAERAQAPLLGVLPHDPKGATAVTEAGLVRSRQLARSALGKAAEELASSLHAYCSVRNRPVDGNAPGVSPVSMAPGAAPLPAGAIDQGPVSPAMEAATAVAARFDTGRWRTAEPGARDQVSSNGSTP